VSNLKKNRVRGGGRGWGGWGDPKILPKTFRKHPKSTVICPKPSRNQSQLGVISSIRCIDESSSVPLRDLFGRRRGAAAGHIGNIRPAQIINTYIYRNADAHADADTGTFQPRNGVIFELQTFRSDEIDQRAEL